MNKSVSFDEISIESFDKFKNIKIVIFDFDDTLYRNLSWEGYSDFFVKNVRQFFPELNNDQFLQLLKNGGYCPDRPAETFSRILIEKMNTAKPLVDFLKTVKFETDWENAKVFSNELLKSLSKKYRLYIVSNSSKENIEFVSSKIGLDISFFKKIMSNQFEKDDLSKTKIIKDILYEEKFDPKCFLVVGDSYEYDIKPAKGLGMQTLLIVNK